MKEDLMKKVFGTQDFQPYTIPDSGLNAWLLVKLENLSLLILESKEEVEFASSGHPEEEFVWVLEGSLEFKHGPVVKANEGIFIVPELPYAGKYSGKLVMIRCIQRIESKINPDAMNRVIRLEEIETIHDDTGAKIEPLAITENMSILGKERKPGGEFQDPVGHPEEEIVYVLQGQVEYDDGRTIRAGEAGCNLPDAPHSGIYGKIGIPRIIEVKSPSEERFAKFRL